MSTSHKKRAYVAVDHGTTITTAQLVNCNLCGIIDYSCPIIKRGNNSHGDANLLKLLTNIIK